MSEQQRGAQSPQANQQRADDQGGRKDAGQQGLPGSALSGASVDNASSGSGVGRQSGQQREHGHMNAEDQARDGAGAAHGKGKGDAGRKASDGTDRVGGHPEASPEGVSRGSNGGLGRDDAAG